MGVDQKTKLVSLSETHDAALYGDYILREKRNWGDVLFDFDSIKFEGSANISTSSGNGASSSSQSTKIPNEMPFRTATADKLQTSFVPLTVEYLLMILAPIMPRHFSIASAPSSSTDLDEQGMIGYSMRHGKFGFNLDLCVAVVEGETRRGRKYAGLCSKYLSSLKPS